jgi:hypothetical protein
MRRALTMGLGALLVFAVVLCVRLPTRWAVKFLPADVRCTAPEGSIWNGGCAQLDVRNLALGAAQWEFDAVPLLRGALAGTARLQRADGQLGGRFELHRNGRIDAWDLRGDLPLDPQLMPFFPANWRGRVQLDVARLAAQGRKLELLKGVVSARDILATGPRPDAFGSYELRVQEPPDATGKLHGKLRDLDGPFSLDANLTLDRDGIWDVQGQVAARPGANLVVARQLEILGTPDAAGRRNFSLSNRQ